MFPPCARWAGPHPQDRPRTALPGWGSALRGGAYRSPAPCLRDGGGGRRPSCCLRHRLLQGGRWVLFARPVAGSPSGQAAAMSAEAADREAATSSRPCTPPQTSWFEFLLEEALLEQHLQKPSPGACGAARPGPALLCPALLAAASSPRPWARPGVPPQLLTGPGGKPLARLPAGPFPRRLRPAARPLPPPSRGLLLAPPPPALLPSSLPPSFLRLRLPPGGAPRGW